MTEKNISNIDSALTHMKAFSRVSLGTTQAIQQMREKVIFTDGVMPSKLKCLSAVLWSISARCEPCIKFYVFKAKEAGATLEELGEMLSIACTMGGCVGEMWALKAFQAYQEKNEPPQACCE